MKGASGYVPVLTPSRWATVRARIRNAGKVYAPAGIGMGVLRDATGARTGWGIVRKRGQAIYTVAAVQGSDSWIAAAMWACSAYGTTEITRGEIGVPPDMVFAIRTPTGALEGQVVQGEWTLLARAPEWLSLPGREATTGLRAVHGTVEDGQSLFVLLADLASGRRPTVALRGLMVETGHSMYNTETAEA